MGERIVQGEDSQFSSRYEELLLIEVACKLFLPSLYATFLTRAEYVECSCAGGHISGMLLCLADTSVTSKTWYSMATAFQGNENQVCILNNFNYYL